jgi:hypothetical protein
MCASALLSRADGGGGLYFKKACLEWGGKLVATRALDLEHGKRAVGSQLRLAFI